MSSNDKKDKAITRRQFFKGAATAGAAGMLLTPGSRPLFGESKPWLPDKWDYEADVVVIGNGYAGQNAAIFSHDGGAKALIIDKAPEKYAGGNSMVCGGGMTIPTDIKKATPYYHALSFGTSPKELCDFMAEALYKVPEQLNKLGIELAAWAARPSPKRPSPQRGVRSLPGGTNTTIYSIKRPEDAPPDAGSGFLLHMALDKCVKSRGIPIHYETRARHLIQDPITKRIVGAIAEQNGRKIYLKAKKAVVMACGGYENNPEMLSSFNYPGIKIYPWGSPYNTGDGINMVSEIGAPLWHMFSIEWDMPSMKAASEQAGVSVSDRFMGSYIYVNKYGKRFMDESKNIVHSKESLELTYFDNDRVEYPNQPFYAIFDESVQSRLGGGRRGMTWNGAFGVYQWSENSKAEIEKGWVQKGDTIKDLAANMKIDPDALEETITNYNQYCGAKKDPDFNRRENNLRALTTPPYYGMELGLTIINTQGGPKHNTKAQTLDQYDKPIPGLYSPGEFGSFFGFLYPGGSNVAEAIAFGRIAGENAAVEKPWS